MATGSFATAFGCIDGRAVGPTLAYLTHYLSVDYVDFITSAGPDKVLIQGSLTKVEDIKQQLLISINAHHSTTIAIVAHHDCAGNPVSREEHLAAIRTCVQLVETWQLGVRVLGLWVNDQWEIERICDSQESLRKAS